MNSIHQARLAQSVEHQTLNRKVVGSSPTVDKEFFILFFVASDALLASRLANEIKHDVHPSYICA